MKPYLKYIKNVRKIPIPQVKFVTELTGEREDVVETYINEFNGVDRSEYGEYHGTLYAMIRITKPNVIVETGVFEGAGSCAILLALRRNDKGVLYSLDIPSPYLPTKKEAGWRIPQHLRSRWNLIIGRSSDELQKLLIYLGEIDMFLHDSEHSYENMRFEYETAWEYIIGGGLLLSHDITRNMAFRSFAIQHSKKYYYMLHNLAGFRK